MTNWPSDFQTTSSRLEGVRTGPELFGRTSEKTNAPKNNCDTEILASLLAIQSKLAGLLRRDTPFTGFNTHSRVPRAKFEPPAGGANDSTAAANYGIINLNVDLVHSAPREFLQGFLEALIELHVWCERCLWIENPSFRKPYSHDYRGRDYRLMALRVGLAERIDASGNDTANNVVFRLVAGGRADLTFSKILVGDDFARLRAAVPYRVETPEDIKRRNTKNASHTAFICGTCGEQVTGKPTSDVLCGRCTAPHPGNVRMVHSAESTLAARRAALSTKCRGAGAPPA